MKLPPHDKIAHFLLGISAAALASPFGLPAMIAAPIIIGAGKEIHDHYFGGMVELADFAYTVAGGAAFVGWILFLAEVML